MKKELDNRKIKELIRLYESFHNKSEEEEKWKAFQAIARNRPLSDDLISSYFSTSPTYTDFKDINKIQKTFLTLLETLDENLYWKKKYLHPKYAIQDFFLLPGSIFGFLLNHGFKRASLFFLSCLSWIATIFISVYASDIRNFIDYLVKKITEII